MKKLISLLLALVMVFAFAACGEKAPDSGAELPDGNGEITGDYADFKIGAILIHDENSGYDLAHINGIKSAVNALGLSEDQITWKYNISEDEACYDTAVDLAESGCDIIFSDSYGHQSYMQQAAGEYEDVIFVAATGDTAASSGLANLKNIFTYVYESRYVSGVVAGMKLKELLDEGLVTEPYVGYVGAKPYAEVVSGYTAFFLGVQSIVPEAYMDVIYTGEWYDPTREAEAANALMSKGCVIIGQHADSTGAPSAVQAAKDGGAVVYSVGYNIDMLAVAPTAALTSALNNWGAVYTPTIQKALEGGAAAIPDDYATGIVNDGVSVSVLGPECAEGTQEKLDEVWAALADGSLNIFDTAKFTVDGETVTSFLALDTDGDFEGDEGEAIEDGIFYESKLRSAPYFSLRIDGITELS
ncbi:MAG: BMP family ABC transporter substrate-binding protein [Clostridiales bacterium]|nr:BMP family ABC transporter substrate-binding protein [Clostridiales bacterium]